MVGHDADGSGMVYTVVVTAVVGGGVIVFVVADTTIHNNIIIIVIVLAIVILIMNSITISNPAFLPSSLPSIPSIPPSLQDWLYNLQQHLCRNSSSNSNSNRGNSNSNSNRNSNSSNSSTYAVTLTYYKSLTSPKTPVTAPAKLLTSAKTSLSNNSLQERQRQHQQSQEH